MSLLARASRKPRHSTLAWSPKTQQYYYPSGRAPAGARAGWFVKSSAIRGAVDADIVAGKRRLESLGREAQALCQRYQRGEISRRAYNGGIRAWRDEAAVMVKNLHLNNATAARGGIAQMGSREYGRVGARLRFHYERLDNFAREITEDPDIILGKMPGKMPFMQRLGLYADTALFTYEQERVASHAEQGFEEYRNVLHSLDPCESGKRGTTGCEDVSDDGWQPIGSLPEIGKRSCGPACKCTWQFRREKKAARQ